MDKQIKVVIGANYGDEGKGLVSYCLANKANEEGRKILTVLYNGGAQRAHTANGKIFHCEGTGAAVGSDTYYDLYFMLDPIAAWLEQVKVYIHPRCRVVLPCDVVNNRDTEISRKKTCREHGSCGMGIFEACKRSLNKPYSIVAKDLFDMDRWVLYDRLIYIEEEYGYPRDILYNNDNFLRAIEYLKENCSIVLPNDILKRYDTIIYEGGQGLMLDQCNKADFPFLTPSSTGLTNIAWQIYDMEMKNSEIIPELYFVSRSYLTRHGNGPLPKECKREDINQEIVDMTNRPNPWQGEIRYGYLDTASLIDRVTSNTESFDKVCGHKTKAVTNLVFTHLNYTDGKLCTGRKCYEKIQKLPFINHIYGSDKKDDMGVIV